jgi:hypothetical protein
VKTPDERPFEDYIRRVLIDELKVAEILSDAGPVTLAGNLGTIDFNSMKGEWTIDMTFVSSNGRSLLLPILYSYKTGPAFTFPVAVQVRIDRLVHHPDFPALLK